MDATFFELAQALRETSAIGHQMIARMEGSVVPDELAIMRKRQGLVEASAVMVADLAPHETLARALIKVGALVEFPTFSANTLDVEPGSRVLVRGICTEVHPNEALIQAAFSGERVAQRFVITRADVVGVERIPAGLEPPALTGWQRGV